jgi:hypothetical protein
LNINPDESIDTDGGDETQKRFHYQDAYAALEVARLLSNKLHYDSVYIELIEDILIKLKTGKFIGVQVKSQKDANAWFTFGNEHIIGALQHFIEHEKKFPKKFKRYVLCTNCGFPKENKASNLPYCLSVIRKNDDLASCTKVVDFSNSIEAIKENKDYTDNLILDTFRKIEATTWSSLSNYERLLPLDIRDVMDTKYDDITVMENIAKQLVEMTVTAARLGKSGNEPSYYDWLMNPRKAEFDAIIQKKRITRDRVQSIIDSSVKQPGLLSGLSPLPTEDWPRAMQRLERKMRKGGISDEEINRIKDYDNSVFDLIVRWNYKYKKVATEERAEHLRLIVDRECNYAYNKCKQLGEPFGQEMLDLVRERLTQRQIDVSQRFQNECLIEHLEGIAGMLTERCDVWWSKKFNVADIEK